MAATEPIRDRKQLKALADYFLKRGQLRNYTLIIMGTSTTLRISDLLRLRWSDVYDELHRTFRTHITIIEKKTKKTKTIALNKQVLQALRLYFPHRRGDFIFVSNHKEGKAISRVQAWRIIHAAVVAVGVEGKIRKRRTHEGERNMFSGLLVCADCGHNLHFHFNQGNPDIKYFNCSNYKGNRGSCTSTHYVRVDFLEQVVLGEIRRLTKFASQFEDEFVKAVIGHSQQAEATDRKLKEKELKALQARDEELDGLFERIYEDNVSGKLSDDRFARMSRRYEEEQKELAEKIKALRAEIDKQSSQSMTTDMFISLVRKYTRARKLTPRMLNELIEKIEVFNAEKVDGVWEQRLRIHYNCVGVIEIPDLIPLPTPEVSVNTRKGVVVNYAPSTIAG